MATQANVGFRSGLFPCEAPTLRYSMIVGDLAMVLWNALSGSDCEVFFSGLRVAGPGLYAFPAIVVIRGKLEFPENDEDSVTNPKVIVEILSPTKGDFKRGRKFARYRLIVSLWEGSNPRLQATASARSAAQ
jgi:Uma2 family endonuclease